MRVKTFYRLLRIISCFVLFFIFWSYGQAYAPIAWAVTEARDTKGQKAEHSGQARQKTTEEKFQESLDRIGEAGTDRAKLRAERDTIQQLDAELQKQFKETENRISGLTDTVKQRHRNFTKKYNENLNVLKTHLVSIEMAKADAEVQYFSFQIHAEGRGGDDNYGDNKECRF